MRAFVRVFDVVVIIINVAEWSMAFADKKGAHTNDQDLKPKYR